MGDYGNYRPGHSLHFIHADKIANSPWGWRPGVVHTYVKRIATIVYLEEGSIEVWQASQLPISPGTPVRVHERYYALDVGGVWFNVKVVGGGLGHVPTPDLPELWRPEVPIVVTDFSTGRGHAASPDE